MFYFLSIDWLFIRWKRQRAQRSKTLLSPLHEVCSRRMLQHALTSTNRSSYSFKRVRVNTSYSRNMLKQTYAVYKAYYRDIDRLLPFKFLYLSLTVSVSLVLCSVHTSCLIHRANVSLDLTAWHWAKARTNHDYRSEASTSRWNADKK